MSKQAKEKKKKLVNKVSIKYTKKEKTNKDNKTKVYKFTLENGTKASAHATITEAVLPIKFNQCFTETLHGQPPVVHKAKTVKNVVVPSINLKLQVNDSTIYIARSCCKPPDKFSYNTGILLCVKRILKVDTATKRLSKKDHEIIIRNICPFLFKKEK